MEEVTLSLAFLAGFVSFLSPCVLPIIPGFLVYLAGTSLEEARFHRRAIFFSSLFFVLGFSAVFAALGVLLNTVLEAVAPSAEEWFARVGGAIIILFGLQLLGLVRIPFLEGEHRLAVRKRFGSRYLTSFVFGAAFAAGWTPCVGAVLGSVIALSAFNPSLSFLLFFSYSLGMSFPFLLVGAFSFQASQFIGRHLRALSYASKAFGLLLVALGILAFTQNLGLLFSFNLLNELIL